MNHLNVYSPTKYRFLKNILISDMIGGFQETGLITVTAAIKGKYLSQSNLIIYSKESLQCSMPHFLLLCSVIHSQMKCIWKHLEWYSVQIISIIWCLLSWNQNPSICSLLSVLFTSLSCPRVSHAGRATETGPGSCIVQCTRVPGSHAGVMSWYCPTTNCQQQKVLLLTFTVIIETYIQWG